MQEQNNGLFQVAAKYLNVYLAVSEIISIFAAGNMLNPIKP